MATIQVILQGQPRMTIFNVYDYPIVLQFGDKRAYNEAFWVLPSDTRRIQAWRLSEIRVSDGRLDVLVDGPEGFRYGPHPTDWIRSYYPRGKDFALIQFDPVTRVRSGVTLIAGNEGLIIDELGSGVPPAPEAPTA